MKIIVHNKHYYFIIISILKYTVSYSTGQFNAAKYAFSTLNK
jgi:hypothetical protein